MKPLSHWLGSAVVLASFPLVAASVGIARWSGDSAESTASEPAVSAPPAGPPVRLEMTMSIPQVAPNDAFVARRELDSAHLFDVEGVHAANMLHPAHDVLLGDQDPVIGIVVGGEARAYAIEAFAARNIRQVEDLGVHIVHDSVGECPICVTHCDRTHASRVLTRRSKEAAASPAAVRLGGWNRSLLLLIDGQRYEQSSAEVPLDDLPFETTTWGEWRVKHPQARVYAGY